MRGWFDIATLSNQLRILANQKTILSNQNTMLNLLHSLSERQDKLMAAFDDIKDLLTKIDAATTDVGNVLKDLRDKVGVGMTQAQVDEIKGGLSAEIDKLTAMGKDPNNPIP